MQADRAAPESLHSPELPIFSDRVPDLVQAFRLAGNSLASAKPEQSYLPYFEDVYTLAHSLKGVIGILPCPQPMADFIHALNKELYRTLAGTAICRKNAEAGDIFLRLADALDLEKASETADMALLNQELAKLTAIYTEDIDHQARLREVPTHLFYVSEQVSKKAREITLLHLNHLVLEDEIRLEEVPLWRAQLNEALISPDFGRGIVVNFLPFLSPERSKSLMLWAWVAASCFSRAALKQRIKEVMPKVSIGKL